MGADFFWPTLYIWKLATVCSRTISFIVLTSQYSAPSGGRALQLFMLATQAEKPKNDSQRQFFLRF